LYPVGGTEEDVLSSNGSIAIIASEQYLLMRREIKNYEIVLYHDDIEPAVSDILVVMTCLPLVPEYVLRKFSNAVYFFDDLNIWRLKSDAAYHTRMDNVKAVLHPVKNVADRLARDTAIPTFHVPWSISRLPDNPPKKSKEPSFFVDMDARPGHLNSILYGIEFIRAIRPLEAPVYIPKSAHAEVPPELLSYVTEASTMPHDEFLMFLSHKWFYVSGISGSYEYSILESAFLGCGLISLYSAVVEEHRARSFFLNYEGQAGFLDELKQALLDFDPGKIASEARAIYPNDAVAKIPDILNSVFRG
jgi:hypothetical protein